jgi:hypothetical protein
VLVIHIVILKLLGRLTEGSQFQDSLGKKYTRPHLNQQLAMHNCHPKLHRRLRMKGLQFQARQKKTKKFVRPCIKGEKAGHGDRRLSSQLQEYNHKIGGLRFRSAWAKPEILFPKLIRAKSARGLAQAVECCTLSSNSSTVKKAHIFA